MTKTLLRAGALTCALLTTTCLTAPAMAQSTSDVAPPVRYQTDENGIDLTRGEHLLNVTDVAIGPAGQGGLAYTRQLRRTGGGNPYDLGLFQTGTSWRASVGLRSYAFTQSGSTYTSTDGSGATLTQSGTTRTLRLPDGTVIVYNYNVIATGDTARKSRATSILYPSGEQTTLTWVSTTYCSNNLDGCVPNQVGVRLQAVSSASGYQLHLNYGDATATILAEFNLWKRLNSITAINTTVDACNPAAHSCTYTQTWPTTSYSGASVTDPVGRTASYSSTATTTSIRRPGSSSDDVVYTYSGGAITQVVRDGMTWGYNYSVSGNIATMVVTEPGVGRTRTIVSDLNVGLPTSVTDELGKVTSYAYDTAGRLTRITAPEGNYVQYSYDARGNVTEVRRRDKAGTSANDIVTSASYPATCANPVTCNQPITTTDARNNVTDYAYDSTHGGVTSVTGPAPTTGAVRPQLRYAYSALTLPGGGTTYRLSQVSQCRTLASCANQADETRTVIAYGQANLMPTSVTVRDGTGTLTATATTGYDVYARPITTDGPLTGSADTVRTRYNLASEVVGVIGPDPDSSGPGKHQAQRTTYDATTGLVTRTETGTVNSQSDSDWAAFAPLETAEASYDAYRRPVRQTLKGSDSIVQAVTDLSYDIGGRPDCSATRMNPSAWATVVAACTAQATGSFGPDRIGRTVYDLAGRPQSTGTALGTADETWSYVLRTDNGQVSYLVDVANGANNTTAFQYDGQDRPIATYYPNASGGGVNWSDYDAVGYDAAGNVTSRRTRANETLGYSYDNLNRLLVKVVPERTGLDPSSTRDVYYGYDLGSRPLYARFDSPTGQGVSYAYDGLGRQVASALVMDGVTRQLNYQYDAAGNRTRITWPDGVPFDTSYHPSGAANALSDPYGSTLVAFAYDAAGRASALGRPGATSGFQYDGIGRLNSLTHYLAAGLDVQWTFAHNPASQIVTGTRSNDAYAYTGHANGSVSSSADGQNRITAAGGATLQYDANGNLTSDGTSTFIYDIENRLVGRSGGVGLRYDPLGRLYEVTSASGTTRFLYDGAALVAEYDIYGTTLARYVYGSSTGIDNPLLWYAGGGALASDRRNLLADERGSIVAIGDNAGNRLAVNRYDEYGVPATTNTGRFGYTGQVWLPELGMYYYRARIYNPALGRFMQTDPIGYGAGLNLYAYVGNDPVNSADPSGTTGLGICTGTLIVTSCNNQQNPTPLCTTCSGSSSGGWILVTRQGGVTNFDETNFAVTGTIRIWVPNPISLFFGDSRVGPGHLYDSTEQVCRVPLTQSERGQINRATAVPDGTISPGRDAGTYPVGGSLLGFIPVIGGYVNTRFSADGNIAVNTTTSVHIFVGRVERVIYSNNNGTFIRTTGSGNAGDSVVGNARDALNDALGPGIFRQQNELAQTYAREINTSC